MKKFLLPEHLIRLFGPLLLVAALLLALPAKAANTFQAAASLPEVRSNFTATLLNNGKILIAGGSGSGAVALKTAALYDPATGAWTATGAMTITRASHTATLLPSGKVLVEGGAGAGAGGDAALQGYRNSGEVYNPATGTWTAAASAMSDARQFASATLLADGKVLIAGGSNSTGALKTAAIFDPVLNTFASTTTVMNLARGNHTATLLPSGKVLVCGGNNGTTRIQSGELYDPTASTWTLSGTQAIGRSSQTATLLTTGKVLLTGGDDGTNSQGFADLYDPAVTSGNPFTQLTGTLNAPRTRHTASLLPSGQVLIAGGTTPAGIKVNSAELFDPTTAAFSALGNLVTGHSSHAATLLPTGRVLISGGFDGPAPTASTELFDPLAGSWEDTGSLDSIRSGASLVGLVNGRILAIGGGNPVSGTPVGTAEAYDPGTENWSKAGTLKTARSGSMGVLLPGGKVLASGGMTGGGPLASAELYDPATNSWSLTGSMGLSRAQSTITLLQNGKVLVAGGLSSNPPGGSSPFLSSAEIYDLKTGIWSPTGAMARPRFQHTATLLPNGKVLVCGGFQGSDTTATAELYDPQTGTWSSTGSMATERTGHASVLLPDGRVLAMAGKMFVTSGPVMNAEIYTPATGLWTPGGTMSEDRSSFQATVLYSGKVLVAGGTRASNSGTVTATEIYDPAVGTWKADAPSSSGGSAFFSSDAGIFLRNGKFMLTGTSFENDGSFKSLVQLYDEGRGDQRAWRPNVATATLDGFRSLTVTGSGFRGPSGASGGGVQDSSTNYPVVLWQTPGNQYGTYLPLDETVGFSGTSLHTAAVPLFLGYGTATVFVNGAASVSMRVSSDFSAILDSDGDGMNDLAEANASQFGFDPLKPQPDLVAQFGAAATSAGFYTQAQYDASRTQGRNAVINSPNTYSLYSAAQIQALNVNVPLIQRDAISGLFKLTLGLGKTPALGATPFTPFAFDVAGSQMQIVNGKIEFTFPSTNGAAFFQIQVQH